MCNCKNVELQSYSNQTILQYPDWFVSEKRIRVAGIDNCILAEITYLWSLGIQTLESCCGHNKVQGYICVAEGHEYKMVALGYKRNQSNFRNENGYDENGYRKDMFNPMTKYD